MKESLKEEFDNLLKMESIEEELDFRADLLAMQFLGLVDEKMERNNISKKALAERIGTSASFITQLFRGDKKPNWKLLARMSDALDINFKIITDDLIDEKVGEAIMDYHRKWTHTQKYLRLRNQKSNPNLVMAVEPTGEDEYAFAG